MRPDRTYKSYWRTRIDDSVMREPSLEVCLPKWATLSDLNPALLACDVLPELWPAGEISVQSVHDYFVGGHSVLVPMEGYEDTFFIPACEPDQVDEAISEAVAQGLIWMTNGPASILGEPIPAGVLAPSAELRPPPGPIAVGELMAQEIPDAWKDGKSNAFAIMTAISAKRGVNLPWNVVRSAIGEGIRAQWLELAEGSAPLDTDLSGAQSVLLQTPTTKPVGVRDFTDDYQEGVLAAEATLEGHGIQDLAELMPEILEAAAGDPIVFKVRIQFGGEKEPDEEKVERINALLSEALEELRLGRGGLR